MKKHTKLLLALGWSIMHYTAQAQFVVTQATPTQAAQEICLAAGMVTNISATGSPLCIGTFTNSGSMLPMSSGVFISSGVVTDFNGVAINSQGGYTTPSGPAMAGDAQLSTLCGCVTNDAASLEFDFVALSDSLQIRFTFGSEEYNEYTCSQFNDIFAIFLSGPGYTGSENIAKIPNTSIPVAINSVNNGLVGTFGNAAECTSPAGSLAYSNYFIDNQNGAYIEFDGMTVPITTKAALIPGQTYHLKMVVADVFDTAFDSGVFIETGSFAFNGQLDTFEFISHSQLGDNNLIENCGSTQLSLQFYHSLDSNYVVPHTIWGSAINGVDYVLLDSSDFTISAGNSVLDIDIVPLMDTLTEGVDTLYISFQTAPSAWDTVAVYIYDYVDTVLVAATGVYLECLTEGVNYQWINCSTGSAITGANDTLFYPTTSGSYAVIVSQGSCADTSDCSSLLLASISGTVYNAHTLGLCDSTATPLQHIAVELQPTGQITFTDAQGNYSFAVSVLDTYSVHLPYIPAPFWGLCPVGDSITVDVNNYSLFDENNFYFDAPPGIRDVSVEVYSFWAPVVGMGHYNFIEFCNNGTVTEGLGTVSFTFDNQVSYIHSTYPNNVAFIGVSGNLATYSYSNLLVGECRTITVLFDLPTTAIMGDSINLCADIDITGVTDFNPADNNDCLSETILGSFDPNAKAVSPYHSGTQWEGGIIYPTETKLRYSLHFQNTGTAPAMNVVLRDTLDNNLFATNIHHVVSSHPCHLDIEGENILVATFTNINLPDSASDYQGSMGFLRFSIDRDANLPLGTTINNRAGIYFDFNAPIITNTVVSTIGEVSALSLPIIPIHILFFPNPFDNSLTIEYELMEATEIQIEVFDILGECVAVWLPNTQQSAGKYQQQFNTANLPQGVYMVNVRTQQGNQAYKVVKGL